MNDFVTLSCPSCGGKLNVQKNSPTYVCPFCGQAHKLREQDIEFFGRCPKCQRNDRVEKLTAILNKNDNLAIKFRPPEILKAVRYHRFRDSTRPDRHLEWIAIDEEQKYPASTTTILFAVVSMVLVIISFAFFPKMESGLNFFFILVLLLGSIGFSILTFINGSKDKQNYNKYKKELINQRANQTKILKARYDKIYYCQRDDTLFIPGEGDTASGSDYEKFLTMPLDTIINKEYTYF